MSDLRPSCFWGRITWTEWESVLGIGWLIIHIARATFPTFLTCGDKTICNSNKHKYQAYVKRKKHLKFYYLVWQVGRIAHNFFTLGGFSFRRYPKGLSVLVKLYLSVSLSQSVSNKVGKKLLLGQYLISLQATPKLYIEGILGLLHLQTWCRIYFWVNSSNFLMILKWKQKLCVEMIPG